LTQLVADGKAVGSIAGNSVDESPAEIESELASARHKAGRKHLESARKKPTIAVAAP
jgi:hypothetical protein